MSGLFEIYAHMQISRNSIALIPIFRRIDIETNYLYVSIQDRCLNITEFKVFTDSDKYRIIPNINATPLRLSQGTYAPNSEGIVSVLRPTTECVSEEVEILKLQDIRDKFEEEGGRITDLSFSMYSLYKVTHPPLSKLLDLSKAVPDCVTETWRESEITFAQKELQYWKRIREENLTPSMSFSEGSALHKFASIEEALRWLEARHNGGEDESEQNMWVSLWEALDRRNVETELLYMLADKFLCAQENWNRRLLRILRRIHFDLRYSSFGGIADRLWDDLRDWGQYSPRFSSLDEAHIAVQVWKLFLVGMFEWRESDWSLESKYISDLVDWISVCLEEISEADYGRLYNTWNADEDSLESGLLIGCNLLESLRDYPDLASATFICIASSTAEVDTGMWNKQLILFEAGRKLTAGDSNGQSRSLLFEEIESLVS